MLKNKKIWLGFGISIMVILTIVFLILGIQRNKVFTVLENHLAYLNINPDIIIKLNYEEKFEQTKQGIIKSEVTTNIIDLELLNDNTKEILENFEFRGKSLEEVINNILDILKSKNIDYQNIIFYTNSKNTNREINLDNADVIIEKIYQENLNEEDILKEVKKVFYKVLFDSNGGSPVASLLVEEGKTISKPETPIRDGYTFEFWTLNDKEFDFKTLIEDNIVLKATWKKNETANNNDKPSTNTNTNSNSSTNNKTSSSTVSSTIDKINLNDFISVAINYYRYSTPYAYMYPTNLSELAPEIGNKTDLVVVDDNAIDPHGNKVDEYDFIWTKWKETILPNLKYDTAKEQSVANGLNDLVNKKTKGVELVVSTEDHQYYYQYRYLTIDNKDFSALNSALTTLRSNLNKELSNVVSGGIYIDFLNAYGVYSKYYKTLDEELCLEFNLVCDRW